MFRSADSAALARIPDQPQWVDTRGMLLTGRARVTFPAPPRFATDGFVVELASRALLSAIDDPPPALIAARARAMAGDVNVLVPPEGAAGVAAGLPGWVGRPVRLHALPQAMPWEATTDPGVLVAEQDAAPALDHVPASLRHEILDALDGHPAARFVPGELPERAAEDASPTGLPVAFAFVEGLAVAFCYPVLQTERYWDLSVDTLDGYRGRGLAGRAARTMIRHLRGRGQSPVWGALESNGASLALARRLGFVEVGRLTVFAAR